METIQLPQPAEEELQLPPVEMQAPLPAPSAGQAKPEQPAAWGASPHPQETPESSKDNGWVFNRPQ